MRRDEALNRLRSRRALLEGAGVTDMYLYGSVARDQADVQSDVDLLVESSRPTFSIFDLAQVKATCRDILGVEADVHHHGGLRRAKIFHDQVAPDLIRVF